MRDWSIRGPVVLRNLLTGKTTTYESAEEFAKAVHRRSVEGRIGDASHLKNRDSFGLWYGYPTYLLYDEHGLIVPIWKVEEILRQTKSKHKTWHERIWGGRRNYVFRRGPVPFIHKCRGGYGYYKHPKTWAEKRAAAALEYDEDAREYNIKPRRSVPNIPEAWDDRARSDIRNRRSWKKNRRHQWKGS